MRILLLGKVGQLGWELRRTLATVGDVTAWDLPEIDFTKTDELRSKVLQAQPQVVINAVAYTAVDKAESQPENVHQINAVAPGMLAETARRLGAAFIHYSTDYVFDGAKGGAYVESDLVNPLNVYGASKLAGEKAVEQAGGAYLNLRTSWVYSTRQGGFVTKVLEWSRTQTVMRMVTDQVGSPTWARSLAEATAQLLAMASGDVFGWVAERAGLYHLGGDGAASRRDWAEAILEYDPRRAEQIVQRLEPALTADFPTPAKRPLYTALDCSRFASVFHLRLPPWKDALRLALEDSR